MIRRSCVRFTRLPPLRGSTGRDNWLKASGYHFAVKDNQDAGIKVLSFFIALPRWQLGRSEMTTTEINHQASPEHINRHRRCRCHRVLGVQHRWT